MDKLKKTNPLAAASIKLTHKYGILKFRGTLHCQEQHRLVFATDDPLEAMSALETLAAQAAPYLGYILILKGEAA